MKRHLGIIGLWLAGALGSAAAEPWTLERALAQALANNPDTRIAQQRIAAAQAGLGQANATAWPKLQFLSSYTGTDNPMYSFGNILNQRSFSPSINFNDVPSTDNLNVRGLVTAPLYTGGAIKSGREAAKANTAAAKEDAAAVRNELGFEVSRAFYTVLKARQFIRAAEAAVNSFENNAAIARKRVEAGSLLRADQLDVEVRLSAAQEDLLRARNANALAERALRNLLGLDQGEFAVADSAPAVSAPDSGDFSGRPELGAMRQRQRAAQAQVRGARSGYVPHLSAFGAVDYNHGWAMNGEDTSYSAGVLLQWDLWDGKMTRSKVAEAQANYDIAQEQERKLRLGLDLEVQQARLNLKEADERLVVTEKAVAQAAESAQLTRSRFEQGLALATQLNDSETALTGARVRQAEAEADHRIAVAALRKALGLPQLDSK